MGSPDEADAVSIACRATVYPAAPLPRFGTGPFSTILKMSCSGTGPKWDISQFADGICGGPEIPGDRRVRRERERGTTWRETGPSQNGTRGARAAAKRFRYIFEQATVSK